ncbi:FtsX-like permease family protein [Paenibacillus beijingensis]|uniref:ABC transporter permease n=1 Tax=Paenibacillus beijingensis TaxID=1126833 RepID=A0A0D5NKW8_9BACL|nr:ABC transporter permease [Paenibacillus beijingensis]AJY75770.1 ABC transporter permease [Paenibacillus beijingensis]
MTFRSLALSNIKGNLRTYSAFFLSSVFSVLIFYLYAAFLFHPDIVNGNIAAAGKVTTMMQVCEYLIVIFSFFFVLYSNSAFLKTRTKEFGLLTLFGTTRGQLRIMVLYESAALAVVSIAAGIGLGMLLSKLFFMGLGVLLNSDVSILFAVPMKAVWLTAGGFFLLFMLISSATVLRVGRKQIIDLLQEARKPKQPPTFSPLLSLLACVCLAAGYTMALKMTMMNFTLFALPVIGLVTLGSYFLFTQLSVALIRLLQRSTRFFYNRTNLITVSQLAFKMKDNARILFAVSIMSAVMVTAVGSVYSIQKVSRDQLLEHVPYTVGFLERGLNTHEVADPQEVRSVIAASGEMLEAEARVVGIAAAKVRIQQTKGKTANFPERSAMAISQTDYNAQAQRLGKKPVKLEDGHAVYVLPYKEMNTGGSGKGGVIEAVINGSPVKLSLDDYAYGAVLSPVAEATYLIVASDKQFMEWDRQTPAERKLVAYGYEIRGWEQALPAVQKIEQLIPADKKAQAQTYRVSSYIETQQSISLALFIGMFISLLFFIAAGSMIYFKLFTELQEDRAQFKALARIGMTAGEIRRIVATQVGMVFFVPCLVGIGHSLFALKALGDLLAAPVWMYGLLVIGIYVVMQTVYFLFSCSTYIHSIRRGTAG